MNFAAVVGASLRSGSALPACRPDNGKPHRQPAEFHLSSGGICPDKAGQLTLFAYDNVVIRSCTDEMHGEWVIAKNEEDNVK